jgi:D-sedoheptulose 7-phosphate isomerase
VDIQASFEEHLAVAAEAATTAVAPLEAIVDATLATLHRGGQVLAFGNGGSAAQALHFAAELSGRFTLDRRALAATALCADIAAITAIGNDLGFEQVFARQVEGVARSGDLVVAITTSGRSPNVLAGLRSARRAGCTTVLLTGRGEQESLALADHALTVPSTVVARIQEVHTLLLHCWAEAVEARMAAS